jgi:pilus assembly protein Flp/PilA
MLQKLGFLAKAFAKSESGATAIEYGLIAAGISVAIIAVVNGVGTQLNVTFTRVKTSLSSQ